MDELAGEPAPAELDAWLRANLERPLIAVGVTLTLEGATGAPPAAWLAPVAAYRELRLRWMPRGVGVEEALRRAAEQDADVLLCWVEAGPAPSDASPVGVAEQPRAVLARLVALADTLGLRDRCVIALVGPAATQELARRAGCDTGFAPPTPLARVLAELAREVAGRDAFRRGGSSPPCYL